MMTQHGAGTGYSALVVDTVRFCCWVSLLCISFGANDSRMCLFQIRLL